MGQRPARKAGARQGGARSFDASGCGVEWPATVGKCGAEGRKCRTPEAIGSVCAGPGEFKAVRNGIEQCTV
jgi:hypothetical protein